MTVITFMKEEREEHEEELDQQKEVEQEENTDIHCEMIYTSAITHA